MDCKAVAAELEPERPTSESTQLAPPGGAPLQMRRKLGGAPLRMDCKAVAAEHVQEPSEILATLSGLYRLLDELGQGSAGVVRRAVRLSDGEEVALKTVRQTDAGIKSMMQKEYDLISHIKHPHIIQALDFFETRMYCVLVLELFRGVSLKSAVHRAPGGRFQEADARRLCEMLFRAVDHLHQNRIVHRDVKAANLLVSHSLADLKLVDFNTARHLVEGGALTMTGTFEYMAPEILQGESPSECGDVWASGLCAHLMLSGRLPLYQAGFARTSEFVSAVATRPVSFQNKEWCHVTGTCKQFVRECLEIDKNSRPAPMTLLAHEWIVGSPPGGSAHAPACTDATPQRSTGSLAHRRSKSSPP